MSSTLDQAETTTAAETFDAEHVDGAVDRGRNRRRWLTRVAVATVVAIVAGLAIGWALLYSPWFTTTAVRVTGTGGLSEADLRAAAAVPEGEALLTLDTAAAAARVSALPGVERAEVSRSWPHTAVIEVVPRSAVAIAAANGGLDLVDRFGVRFATTAELPPDQPVLLAEDGEPMKAAVTVAAALPPQVREQVAAIVVQGDQVRLRLREPGNDPGSDSSSSGQSSESAGTAQIDVAKVANWQLADGRLARVVNWGTSEGSELKAKVLVAMLGAKGTTAATSDGTSSSDGQEISFRWFDVSLPDFPTAGASAPKVVTDELTAAAATQENSAGQASQGSQDTSQGSQASQDTSQGSQDSGTSQGSQSSDQAATGNSQSGSGDPGTSDGSRSSGGTQQ